MKTLVEYIQEKQENVYVVRDRDGEILGVSEIKDFAKEEADEYNKKTPSVKATVNTEKKSDYIK